MRKSFPCPSADRAIYLLDFFLRKKKPTENDLKDDDVRQGLEFIKTIEQAGGEAMVSVKKGSIEINDDPEPDLGEPPIFWNQN